MGTKKKYLLTALITGVAIVDVKTLHYFDSYASADIKTYEKKIEKNTSNQSNLSNSSPDPVPKEVYRIKTLIAQATQTDKQKQQSFKEEVKTEYYSLQFGAFKKKENAERFLKSLPEEIRENAFIYKTEKGFYTVRYGFFDDYQLLKEIQKKIPINSIIVKTQTSKLLDQQVVKTTIKETKKTPKKEKVEKTAKKKKQAEKTQPEEEKTVVIIPEFEEEEINLFEEEKPQIPLYKKIAGAIFFIPAYMLTHKERGFWGKVEFSYSIQNYKYKNTVTRKSFRQYYELNYNGYIYSTRLLSYILDVNFTREDSTVDNSINKNNSKLELLGYGIRMNILRGSRIPVNLFFRKTESPLWYTYYDRTYYTDRKSKIYGISGSTRIFNSNINYGYTHKKTKTEGLDFSEDRKSEDFLLSFSKNLINKSIDATYNKRIDDYTQTYMATGTVRDVNQDIDQLNINYRWRLSKKSNIRANTRYYSNNYSDNKNLSTRVDYNLQHSQKLNLGMGMSASYTEATNTENYFLSFNESLSYFLNKNWNLAHNSLLFFSGGTTEQSILNTGVSVGYNKNLSEKLSVSAGTGTSVQVETGNTERVGGTLSGSLGLNKRFDFLQSNFNISTSVSQYKSSKKDTSTTFNAYERFSASLTQNLRFEHNISYYSQKSKYYTSEGNYSETDYDNVEISNVLRYKRALGWKGKMSLVAGFKYYYGTNRAERTYPYGNLNVSYKFTRRLLSNLNIDVHRDTYYNATYYNISSNIDYKIRSIFVKFDLRYYIEDSDVYGKRENYVTLLKIYRVF